MIQEPNWEQLTSYQHPGWGPRHICKEAIEESARLSKIFAHLWLARHQRNVAPEMLLLLNSRVRRKVIKALGRLEATEAELPLQEMLTAIKDAKADYEIAHAQRKEESDHLRSAGYGQLDNKPWPERPQQKDMPIRLALSRIRARHLKGKTQLEAFAEGVGLSFEHILELSDLLKEQTKDRLKGRFVSYTDGYKILIEILDLLYTMGKAGEDIQAMPSDRLELGPAYLIKFQTASMTEKEEISYLLTYLSTAQSAEVSVQQFMGLGTPAYEELLCWMKEMAEDIENHKPSIPLLRMAGYTEDERFIPLLKCFEGHSDSRVSSYALRYRRALEGREAYPEFP